MPDTHSVKLTCEGISKKTGKRCTASPANGGKLCAGHAGLGVAAPTAQPLREQGLERSKQVVQARAEERKKTLIDRVAEGLEERAGEIVSAYLTAGLDKGDWRALEALVTRVYGKPVERVEDVTERRSVEELSDTERAELRATALEQVRKLRAV
jgi:hypothetical protein